MINFVNYYFRYAYFNLHCLALECTVSVCFFSAWKHLLKFCFKIRTFCGMFIKQVMLLKTECGLKLSIFWNKTVMKSLCYLCQNGGCDLIVRVWLKVNTVTTVYTTNRGTGIQDKIINNRWTVQGQDGPRRRRSCNTHTFKVTMFYYNKRKWENAQQFYVLVRIHESSISTTYPGWMITVNSKLPMWLCKTRSLTEEKKQ